jgi:hypothetical protein
LLDKLGNNNLVYLNPQTSSQGGCVFPKRLNAEFSNVVENQLKEKLD